MATADQDPDTKPPTTPKTNGKDHEDASVSDEGGDSDPGAAADSDATGKEQARRNREDESPS